MNSIAEDTARSRRLCSLRILKENEGAANESILRRSLHILGFRGQQQSDDALLQDALVLEAGGLVTVEHYGSVRTLAISDKGRRFLKRLVGPVDGVKAPYEDD